jgi:hypothetical protein
MIGHARREAHGCDGRDRGGSSETLAAEDAGEAELRAREGTPAGTDVTCDRDSGLRGRIAGARAAFVAGPPPEDTERLRQVPLARGERPARGRRGAGLSRLRDNATGPPLPATRRVASSWAGTGRWGRGMGHYVDVTLYWQRWGGYPDREIPFGPPELWCFVAKEDRAARCLVSPLPDHTPAATPGAGWQQIPPGLLRPVPALLHEAGAFGAPLPLVTGPAVGDYLQVWELTGVVHDRPCHLTVRFTAPGTRWTPLGQRLADTLRALSA